MPPEPHLDERPHDESTDTRPYFCIPYWDAPIGAGAQPWDTGVDRPLPGAVCGYLCDGIHAGPYQPGQPLDVTVDVRNTGGGSAASIATVVVYWADPTVGFAKPHVLAAASIPVPPTRATPGKSTTPTLRGVIPASAPAHVCLLVSVSHPQDRAGTVLDPYHDRHWAQRNLQAVSAAPGAPTIVPGMAANPFAEERTLLLRAGIADERHMRAVAAAVGGSVSIVSQRVTLLNADGSALSEAGRFTETTLTLGPLEERAVQLLVELDEAIPDGTVMPLALELLDTRFERGAVGSLGIALLPE